jgi:Uma2 family endonuclease
MSVSIQKPARPEVVYPDSDGKLIADNTLQFRWIVTIKEGLERVFHDRPDVFVAGDLLWYPVEGKPEICTAPDALVAFGRPKGDRGSYKQWEEDNLAPQVVFEVLSPNNRFRELYRKLTSYEEFGVDEYYIYDPDHDELEGWQRERDKLREIPEMKDWISPRVGIKFDTSGSELKIFGPDGRKFLTFQELAEEHDRLARERGELAMECDAERERAERLAAQLRALEIEPAP